MSRSICTVLAVLGACARAADYNEFVDGDLSNSPTAPTMWNLAAGANLLVGETGPGDPDLLRFTIPAGFELQTIVIEFHNDITQVFAGLQAGSVWTAGIGFDVDPAPMLGWIDFPVDPESVHTGVDILADMGFAPGAQGFTPPLASGAYVMLFQNEFATVRHALSFNLAAVGGNATAADFNHDNQVNAADLGVWRPAYGKTAGADANGDGFSNGIDFLMWQAELGNVGGLAAAATVAEPAAAALSCLGLSLAATSGLKRRMHRLERRV